MYLREDGRGVGGIIVDANGIRHSEKLGQPLIDYLLLVIRNGPGVVVVVWVCKGVYAQMFVKTWKCHSACIYICRNNCQDVMGRTNTGHVRDATCRGVQDARARVCVEGATDSARPYPYIGQNGDTSI